jgi:hypothetical protein
VSERGLLLGLRRRSAVELPVALLDTARPLVPGKGGADMVRASPLACSRDLLLGLASCEGQDLVGETPWAALADSCFRSSSARASAGIPVPSQKK